MTREYGEDAEEFQIDYKIEEEHRKEEDQRTQGYPSYDKEFTVVQASVGFACLFYVFFHNNKPIPQA